MRNERLSLAELIPENEEYHFESYMTSEEFLYGNDMNPLALDWYDYYCCTGDRYEERVLKVLRDWPNDVEDWVREMLIANRGCSGDAHARRCYNEFKRRIL